MRKRGFIPPRRRPFRTFTLEDEITLLADVIRVYYPFVLEDELSISSGLAKASKRLQLCDEIRISDAVFNALRKISLEDEISISDSLYNALRKISLEDSLNVSDSLKNVYKPLHLSDELVLTGACVKSLATGSAINLEDELNIYGSLEIAYDTIKTLTLEDSLHIGDSLKKSVTTIRLEDSLRIGDSLKLAKREILLEDDINVSDSLKHAKRRIQLEDGLDVADSLKLSVNKQTLEDSLRIGDRLVIHRAECEELYDSFESGEFDTNKWCQVLFEYGVEDAIVEVTNIDAHSGNYSLMFENPSGAKYSNKAFMYRQGVGENYVKVSLSAYICVLDRGLNYSGDEAVWFSLLFNLHNLNCGERVGTYCVAEFRYEYADNSVWVISEDYLGDADEVKLNATLQRDTWYRVEIEGETNENNYIATLRLYDLSGNKLCEHTFVFDNYEGIYGGNFGFVGDLDGYGREIAFLIDDLSITACKG